MSDQIVYSVSADISSFSQQMDSLKQQYMSTKKEIDENKIDAPMAESDVQQSLGYMLSSVAGAQNVLKSIQDMTVSLPQGIQDAMGTLVDGMKMSLTSLTSFVRTAGKEVDKDFNKSGFNNSIRFSAASLSQYTEDLRKASEIVTQMSTATRNIYAQNHREISSVVNPAISKMFTKHHTELPDKEIVSELLNNKENYGHISKLLDTYGLTDAKARQQIIEAAVKTSTQRINRLDAQRAYTHAGIAQPDRPIFATDVVKDTYKKAYINGGRYVNENVTPLNTHRASRANRHDFYEGIKSEVLRGNSVAFKAAQDSGLLTLSEGKYRFVKERFAKDDMLDQFGGYVVRERKRAAQGAPQYYKDLNNPYDALALIEKDGRRIREADRLIGLDTRPNANPYYRSGYTRKALLQADKNTHYENPIVGEYDNPALSIPELINIPRMIVRDHNGKPTFMVKRYDKESAKTVYQPNIDFDWKKSGIRENPYDEFITMGRNPILDRLIELHKNEGAKFEDRTFGYGFDSKDKARTGLPLIVNMDLNEFREKDNWGNIKFTQTVDKDGKQVRETYFPKDATELINGLYTGKIEPNLQVTSVNKATGKKEIQNVPYRAFAGKTTAGGTMMFMPSADYDELIKQDKDRGIIPMLQYFSEMENGKELINPATGKPFENNETGLGAYARFYDARNKILSHSIPIEELGGKTPTAALVNFGAFYDAMNTPANQRFDGGGFIAPSVYSKDFQARMGPAKFLAQRFNWRKWLIDANFATKGGEYQGDKGYHFFMPGMSASADDYQIYKAAVEAGLPFNAKSIAYKTRDKEGNLVDKTFDFGGKTFREWRNDMFVDVMNPKFGAMLADTTLKAPGIKSGRITEAQFNEIAKIAQAKNPNSSFLKSKILDEATIGKENINPMVKLTTAQQTELMSMMSDSKYGLGLRLMKDTENYAGKKQFWSPAYMSSVMMTPAMMQRSADNYMNAFKQMSTDEGIIQRMFSGNDIDSMRVKANRSLIYTDSDIKYKIAAEKKNLAAKQLLGYGYFPEESGMLSQMMVAGVNPYSLFNPIGYSLTGHDAEGAAASLKTKKHGVIAPTVGKDGIVNWTRSPYAPGANFFGSPVSRKSAGNYGLTSDSALFNIEDFYELNTGDFDGDFVWANTALKEDKEFRTRTEQRNKKVVALAEKRLQERAELLKSQGKTDEEIKADAMQFAGITDRAFNASSGPTGLGYKVGQAFRMGLFTEKDIAEIDDYANDTYQKGIDMAKHVDVRLSQPTDAVRNAIKTRKPIERLTKDLQQTFEGSGTIGSVDLFKYGLPTYVDQIGTNILSSAKAISEMDAGSLDFFAEQIEQNNKARYENATKEEQDLGNWYGKLVSNKLTGKFQITSTDTLAEGRGYLQKLQNRIAEYQAKNTDKEALARMQEMEREARNVLNTESTIGYTENNLGVISEFNRKNNWSNPVLAHNYATEAQAAAAAILYEERRQQENSRAAELAQTEMEKVFKEQTGKTLTNENRQNVMDRINAAHMYTGFNWSNAKYFTEGSMTIPNTRKVSLTGDNPTYTRKIKTNDRLDPNRLETEVFEAEPESTPITIDFNKNRDWNQMQVARRILTGTTLVDSELEAHGILGSAAHSFMDTYGRARAFRNGKNEKAATEEEALVEATEALKDYLLGAYNEEQGRRVLTKEQEEAQRRAGVSFSEDDYGDIQVSGKNADILKAKVQRLNEGSLKDVAKLYYERSLQNLGERMIMSEGTSFGLDEEGNVIQEDVLKNEGHNGVWIVPQRNGKNVIDFPRFKKDESGNISTIDAGTYFTPDMIKQAANGAITIVDWKSGESGQHDALFQTAYYAHNLEELGKKYYLTGNDEYKKFAKYVNYNADTGAFTSNIKHLEAVNMFGNKNDAVLQADYTMELGDAIAQWVEKGMQNESAEAKLGFIRQLPQNIQPLFKRNVQDNRPVYAPGSNESDYQTETKDIAQFIAEDVTGTFKQLHEIAQGGTGIKDREGNYIDQDKAFLVEKYKEDKEILDNARSFSGKERARLYNLDYKTKDRYTQQIEALQDVFTPHDYETLQKYYQGNHGGDVAADVAMMDANFSAQQREASHQMEEMFRLRQEYFKQMPDKMAVDYGRIAFGQGTALQKLRSGVKKRQQDLSVIDEVYKTDTLYDANLGYIPTDEKEIYSHRYQEPERAENESKKAYRKRRQEYRDKVNKESRELAAAGQERQQDYSERYDLASQNFSEFENEILQQIKEERSQENFVYDLLKGQNMKASIFDLKQKALGYKELGATRLSENGSYAYTDKARTEFAEEETRLTQQAEMLESLKENQQLQNLLKSQGMYDRARLNALMTGTSIDAGTIKDKKMLDFALAYSKLNPDKSINDILSATTTFGNTYGQQMQAQANISLANTQFQTEMADRQRQFQYDRYDRTRYGNPGRFAQYYYQQQDRRFELETQKKTAEHNIRQTQQRLKTETDPKKITEATQALEGYRKAASDADAELQKFNPVQNLFAAGMKTVGDSVQMVVHRLGMQMFRKAINEAKTFVKEFDKQMTTIQMITLKSDTQISQLGEGLIDKAKELKISVSEISQSAATLYRQGLSDNEVNERLEVISKFSKVSGTKVDAATKLITIAMNTGLVSNPEEAADIVTALGDNAATNAAQIEKGIEKAGAAAAADGTTFGELSAMLTAITSTTQIGGNVAGRTLNTIFGRMNKIGTNELIYDENGHAVSGSAVAKLLEAQGVKQYDVNGKKKSSFNVLYELSQKWDSLEDAEQQQLANAIAGTRQYSNFSAIMQGMSEGKIDEYMQLLGESTGITDKKYEIYTQSLEASLTDLRNTFDGLIHDLTDSGALTGALKTFTNMVQGIDNLTQSVGGLGAAFATVLPMLAGITLLKSGIASGNLLLGAAGLAVAGIGSAIATSNGTKISDQERYQNTVQAINDRYDATTSKIERAKALRDLGSNRTGEETQEYTKLVSDLAKMFDLADPTASLDGLTSSLNSVAAAAENAAKHSQEYADIIDQAEDKKEEERVKELAKGSGKWASGAAESLTELRTSLAKSGALDSKYLSGYFGIDEEGNPVIDDYQQFLNVVGLGFSNDKDVGFGKQILGHTLNNWDSVPGLGAFIDWAAPGVRKAVGKNPDQMEYSFTKNRPRLAKLMSDALNYATQSSDKDLFQQLVDEGFVGNTKDDWFNYFGDIHSGKKVSLLPIRMLQQAMAAWAGTDTIESNSKERIISDFKSQIQSYAPWMDEEQVNKISAKAAEDVMNLESTGGYSTSAAYSSVLGKIFNFQSGNYSKDALSAAASAYIDNVVVPKNIEDYYQLEEVNASGYYIDQNKKPGEKGYIVSKEEAERNVKAYNKSLEPITTKETIKGQIKKVFFGDTEFASFDTGDANASTEVYNKYLNAVTKIKEVQDYLKQISEDETSEFQNWTRETKESFANGEIHKVFDSLGLTYTGTIADFLTTKAENMFSVATETFEKGKTTTTTNPLEKPNYKAIQDYALGNRETSYSKYNLDEKTAYRLNADKVYREIQASGSTDIDSWLNYVNNTGFQEFESLYQNGEFGRLMKQVRKNPETGKYEGPADIMDQITQFLLSNGNDFTNRFISDKQKADYATSMFNTLVNREGLAENEQAYLSYEAAAAVETRQRKQRDDEINAQLEKERANREAHGEKYSEADYKAYKKYLEVNTPYTGVVAETARVYSANEKKYLEEIVGTELYKKLVGEEGQTATAEEQRYAQLLINNKRAGLSSLTAGQQLEGIKEVRQNLSTLGLKDGYSRQIADIYMSQWSDWAEYASLIEKQNALPEGEKLSDKDANRLQVLQQSLVNFQKNAQIKFDIQGVEQLEEANKVLEGTASLMQNLQKGGEIAIKAKLDFESELYNNQQLAALLENGTVAEQIETISSITGLKQEQIQNNLPEAKKAAQNILSERNNLTAESLNEISKTNPEVAEFLANRYGYTKQGLGMSTKEALEDLNNFFGVNTGSTYHIDEETGKVYALDGDVRRNASEAVQERYNKNISAGYVYTGTTGTIDRKDMFLGMEKPYTQSELAKAQTDILNQELRHENAADYNLYKKASENLGQAGQKYMAMIRENQYAENNGKEKIYSDEEIEKAKTKALAENAQAVVEAAEADALEEAKYPSTIGGALAAANLKYQQNNKASLAANEIYQNLSSGNIKSVADLSTAVNKSDVKNWKDLLESSEDVRKAFDDMGAKVSEDGESIDFSNVDSSAEGLAAALSMLTQAVAQASEGFNKQKEVLTTGQTYQLANDYLKGKVLDEEKGFSALAEVTGNQELAQTVRNNYSDWSSAKEEYDKFQAMNTTDRAAYLTSHGNKEPIDPGEFNPYAGLSKYNAEYARMLFENAGVGISGITDIERYEKLQELIAAANKGSTKEGIGVLRQQDSIGAFEDYTKGIEGADKWLAASESLEQYGLTMSQAGSLKEGTKEYQNFENAIKGIYGSVKQAAEAHDEFMDNVAQAGQAIRTNSKNMDAYNTGLKKNSKNSKEAASAASDFFTRQNKILQNQKARQNFKNKGVVSDELASMFGVSKKQIKENKQYFLDNLKFFEDSDAEELASLYQGQWDSIASEVTSQLEAKGLTLGNFTTVVDGHAQLDFGKLAGALTDDAKSGVEAIANGLAGIGVTWAAQVSGDGANGSVVIVVSNLGEGGGSGGGGGGGGGKSAVDKLLEKHKRQNAVYEHKQKMLEIQEKEYDYRNDYSGWISNLEQQVKVQHELENSYRSQIAEMENMLKKTKEGTDDYYKLRDAIYAAKESLADITNQINEINAKKIEVLADKLEEKNKPRAHKITMLESYAQRALNQDRFNDYVKYTKQEINQKKAQRDKNTEDIDYWKGKMMEYEKYSDAWKQARQHIWDLEEENAELDNELVQMQLDLARQKLAQVGKVLQQNTQNANHNLNIASTYQSAFEAGGYRSEYDKMIKEQKKANVTLIEENKAAAKEVEKQMKDLEVGSTAWYEAEAALYQYLEAVAQAEVAQMELNRALEESKIEGIAEDYTDATRELSHVNDLLSEQAAEFLDTKDYQAYYAAMESYMDNLPGMIDAQRTALDGLRKAYDEGMAAGTIDPATQRKYLDEINNRESELQRLLIEQQKKEREINKVHIDELFEKQDKAQSDYDHNIKLIGYETSRYQNNGELTNVNTMIGIETEMRKERVKVLEQEIADLEAQQEVVDKGGDNEKRIVDQIKKKCEALESENVQIEKNTKLLEENEKKIMQVQKALENSVDKEIEAEKKREREILNANVSMQDTIVNLLKKRLQNEWDLKKKDIEKEKESLNEYKKLITERFNYRKKASQQADKDEEIAEYRRQLALIEADPSRTKDAKELRRQIEDLEKEKAWAISEDEVAAEAERVDDTIDGMNKFVQYNEELLAEILGDANNFADEMNEILTGSFDESYQKILDFMRKENEAFMNSLPDAQQKMIESWKDTWQTANDILDTNYRRVSEFLYNIDGSLKTEEEVIENFKNIDRQYQDYVEKGDELNAALLVRQWQESYRNVVSALKDDATFTEHEHTVSDVISKIDELKDNVFKVEEMDEKKKAPSVYGLDHGSRAGVKTEDRSKGEGLDLVKVNDYYKKAVAQPKDKDKVSKEQDNINNNKGTYMGSTKWKATIEYRHKETGVLAYSEGTAFDKKEETAKQKAAAAARQKRPPAEYYQEKNVHYTKIYKHGGLVDYTGPAWVDGTKSNPEAFLSAVDTENIRKMLDAFNYVLAAPKMSIYDTEKNGNTTNVGDIHITINQAEFKSDADYDKVAKRIGQAFTKEMSRQGLNLNGYAFG